jgi:hypothetical protein
LEFSPLECFTKIERIAFGVPCADSQPRVTILEAGT